MSGGEIALATRDTILLNSVSKARADWRAPTCAALIGSGIGLALGAAYMTGGMARTTTEQARNSRIAEAAAGGFSESILQSQTAAMDAGVVRIARRHDPLNVSGSAQRDRQSALLAARLERSPATAIALRGPITSTLPVAAPFQLAGALETSRELECLTQAVYYEARGETPAGQAAVAQVVLNRVRHSAFPKSVCGVVFQGAGKRVGCQFSFACDGSMRRGRETAAWNRAQKVASRALSGAVVASVGNATHFHTTNVAPNWGPRLIRTAEVGMHVFYRLGRSVGSAPKTPERVQYASYTATPKPTIKVEGDMRLAIAKAEAVPAEAAAEAGKAASAVVKDADKSPAKLTPITVSPAAPVAADETRVGD